MSATIPARLIAGLALVVTESAGGSGFFQAVSAQTDDATLFVPGLSKARCSFSLLARCAVAR